MSVISANAPQKISRTLNLLSPQLRWAMLFTLLTLVGVLGGIMAERVWEARSLMWGFFLLAYLAGGIPAAREALDELVEQRRLNVDLLMVLAALGAASIGQAADGAILLFLFSLSNTLQDWAMGRTKNAVNALKELHPEGATVRRNGRERWCALAEIQLGDILLLKPGERIVADAVVSRGSTSVDESAITGESRPIDKKLGSELASGTVNLNGSIEAEVVRPAGESTLARLVALMEDAQTQKSRTETVSEKLESPYATLVLLSVPLVYLALRFIGNFPNDDAWYRAMTYMVVASPCAVVISTPAVMLSAMAAAARSGVLFKSSAALDALAGVKTIAFDKTGTLTEGKMAVSEVIAEDPHAFLALAAGLESHSEHPIAAAVVQYAQKQGVSVASSLEHVEAVPGHGIVGEAADGQVWAGNRRLAKRQGARLSAAQETALGGLERQGSSTVIIGKGQEVWGLIGVSDTPRQDAKEAIAQLAPHVPHLVMLTGDKREVAETIAVELNLKEVKAELLPEDKLRIVKELPSPIAMVGDGVNDAPALASADLGIAVGSGTDVALESADLVLMKNDLHKLAAAVKLAKAARRTVIFNLSVAFAVILIVAPLAIAGKVPLPLGVVAHEGGTVFVVFMGLTLLTRRLD